MTHKNEYGCLMAMVKPTYGPHIVRINKTAIPSGILYIDDNDPTYGYGEEPHVTLAYVKKDKFPDISKVLDINVPITRFKYSGRDGKSLYINL